MIIIVQADDTKKVDEIDNNNEEQTDVSYNKDDEVTGEELEKPVQEKPTDVKEVDVQVPTESKINLGKYLVFIIDTRKLLEFVYTHIILFLVSIDYYYRQDDKYKIKRGFDDFFIFLQKFSAMLTKLHIFSL